MPVINPTPSIAFTWHGTDIITDQANAVNTWTDIDLSSIVGAKECLVCMGVGLSGAGSDVVLRRNGHTIDPTITAENTGAAGMVGDGDVDERGYIVVATDSNGIIEYYAAGGNGTYEVMWSIG